MDLVNTSGLRHTWHQRSSPGKFTMVLTLTSSQLESSSSFWFKAFSPSLRPRKTNISTTCYKKATSQNIGRKSAALPAHRTSRTSASKCLAWPQKKGLPSIKSKTSISTSNSSMKSTFEAISLDKFMELNNLNLQWRKWIMLRLWLNKLIVKNNMK